MRQNRFEYSSTTDPRTECEKPRKNNGSLHLWDSLRRSKKNYNRNCDLGVDPERLVAVDRAGESEGGSDAEWHAQSMIKTWYNSKYELSFCDQELLVSFPRIATNDEA